VFDDTIEIVPGKHRQLYIPFDTIVNYTGIDNVVIQDYQYNPAFPPPLFTPYITQMPNTGPIRTLIALDYYDLDPNDPPKLMGKKTDFTFTTFVLNPETNYGVISGTVYDTSGNAMSNANVSVKGTSVNTQTDTEGKYKLPELPYGNYSIKVSLTGYSEDSLMVSLDTSSLIQNFHLVKRAQIQIAGSVYGDNDTTQPLQNVDVVATGLTHVHVQTGADGSFMLDSIFGVSDYNITFSLYGYYDTTLSVNVTNQNINMGKVVLRQEFISPLNVFATNGSNVVLKWISPFMSNQVKLQNDHNVISYSYTNSPNEDVWLGNVFTIKDTTTLTSAEIRTDVYKNLNGLVSIDVFDRGTEDLLASSKPFIIYADSTQTIDLPNIVVYNDIYVMLHWKDNPTSTNALGIDFSSDTIPNTAYIKYPGQSFVKFSYYLGHNAPNMSFLVRVNTLVKGSHISNNESATYNVYRGLAKEFPNVDKWEMLNSTPVNGFTFTDKNWWEVQPGKYRYAVEALYPKGTSEMTFSNELDAVATGVNDIVNNEKTISLYPVPAKNSLSIVFHNLEYQQIKVKIVNITGKVFDEFTLLGGNNVTKTRNVSKYANGLYFLKVTMDSHVITKKFLVKH